MSIPATIRPSVGQSLITKVSRLFNGTISDVLNELFQNARRAGASRIDVDVVQYENGPALFITDDGIGIDNPASFVTLGQSGWNVEIARREDPAGMGVFSLAGKRVTVRSFSKDANAGWTVTIPEDGWEGGVPLPVEPSSIQEGTQIIIAMPPAWLTDLNVKVQLAAQFFPLPVRFRGNLLPRTEFLENAHRVETWNGCRIGVYRADRVELADMWRINFHGIKVPCDMPKVSEIGTSFKWAVLIDIVDAPALQLVLPARKEMVENAALEALRVEAEAAIYRTIALESSHRLPFQHWQRAMELGINLPEASPWLHAWTPRSAEVRSRTGNERIESGPMIILFDHEPDIEQCATPFLNQDSLGYIPVCEEDKFRGYGWYDRLPRIPDISFSIELQDRHFNYSSDQTTPEDVESGRADNITMLVPVVRSAEFDEPFALLGFPLDMLVCANDSYCLDEAHVFVSKDAEVKPFALAELIMACCFHYDEDSDCDCWDTQYRNFDRDARNIANNILLGAEDALLEQIRSAFREDIQWLIPKDRCITLTASTDNVSLSIADAA